MHVAKLEVESLSPAIDYGTNTLVLLFGSCILRIHDHMTPEEKAREKIDGMLLQCGWEVQDKNHVNLSAARGVAVCELSFATGDPDYTLFVDGKAIDTTEAKPEERLADADRGGSGAEQLSVVAELEAVVSANLQCATASASPFCREHSREN